MSDLRRLFGLYRAYRGWMALGLLLSLLTLFGNIGLMALSGWFIAAMGLAGVAGTSMNYFTPAAGIRGLAILRTGGRYAERLVTHEATFRLLAELRTWFYNHLEPLAPAALERYRSGDLLSRIRGDIDSLDHLYLRIALPLASALLAGLACAAVLAAFAPALGLALLAMAALAGVAVPLWVQSRAAAPGQGVVDARAQLRAAVVDGLQGLAELTVDGANARQLQQVADLGDAWLADQVRLNRLAALSQAAVGLAANLALWLVLWLGVPLVRDGTLAPPQLAAVALLALAAFEALAPVPLAFQVLGETRAAARRLFAIVDQAPAVTEPPGPAPEPRHFDIRFDQVAFRYDDAAPALVDLDLHLDEGERLAVIGPSGAGKTTLLQLLLRFRAPQTGCIRLGGHDLASFPGAALRRHIAVVSQHTHLFNTSIRANLLLAAPEASPGRLEQVCRAVQLQDWIDSLPDGLDTWVGETGTRVSGGQARRIAIARALLKDAPVLVLDEPTEGLDGATERALLRDLAPAMRGRTVLLITHRLRDLSLVDRIAVLEQGRLVDVGTAAEVAARNPQLQQLAELGG